MSRKFGVELEYIFNPDMFDAPPIFFSKYDEERWWMDRKRDFRTRVADKLTESGIDTNYRVYIHRDISTWKIVYDRSVGIQGYNGLELVSVPLYGNKGMQELKEVLKTINKYVIPDKSCGAHVHLDIRKPYCVNGFLILNMYKVAYLFEPVFFYLFSKYRYHSRNTHSDLMCMAFGRNETGGVSVFNSVERIVKDLVKDGYDPATVNAQVIQRITGIGGRPAVSSRYWLNFTSYWRHGTVEFRLHSSTKSFKKLRYWIGLLQKYIAICNVMEEIDIGPYRPITFNEFADFFGISREARSFYARRFRMFSGKDIDEPVLITERRPQ